MPRRLCLLALCLLTLAMLLLVAAPTRAQDRKSILPPDGEGAFKSKPFKDAKQRFEAINKPTEGEKANRDSADDRGAIDWMAQYYTYRITWDGVTADTGGAHKLMDEFFLQVGTATSPAMRQNNPAFTEMFVKALAQKARDVIQTRQTVAAVNGAHMLARLAEAGSEEAGDACLDALKDAEGFLEPRARAGVQYYALQGLKHLLGLWEQAPTGPDAPPAPAARKAKEAGYLEALVEVIQRKPPAGTNLSSPEEVAGLQMFRREAVRALAQYRSPAVTGAKGAVTLPTALVLLKVVNSDGLTPKTRIDEQVEAGIGVARAASKSVPSYQPDYAAAQLGNLVVELAHQAGPKPQPDQKTPNYPWKLHAARLSDALEWMRADVQDAADKAGAAYVNQVVTRSLPVLKEIELNDKADAANLRGWLTNNAPPHDTLYKGVADSTVHPPGEGAEEPAPPAKPAVGEKKPTDRKPTDKKPDEKPMPPRKP